MLRVKGSPGASVLNAYFIAAGLFWKRKVGWNVQGLSNESEWD